MIQCRLTILDEVSSTQDVVREKAVVGEPEGYAVMAWRQTCGRGRLGRTWYSSPDNLALSLLLRPNLPAEHAPILGFLAAIAAVRTARDAGATTAMLKWPNDVIVGDRKLAGILPEARIGKHGLDFVIIGLGLNANSDGSDIPLESTGRVTSLRLETNVNHEVESVARAFLDHMAVLYDESVERGTTFIAPLWEHYWAHKGTLLQRDGMCGTAHSIDTNGRLNLAAPDGRMVTIDAGEVEPVREPDRGNSGKTA